MITIWECDPTPLLSQPEMLLSEVAEKVKAIENQRQKGNIAPCVELLAGINYSE